jgi:hypothetical protein
MLFVSDSVIQARRQLLADMANKKIDAEQAFTQALALDADDHVSLVTLAGHRSSAGDSAAAEQLYWRAVQAQPCYWLPYLRLSRLLEGEAGLSRGLAELAIRKALPDVDATEELEKAEVPFLRKLAGTKTGDLEKIADRLRELRVDEPASVTARLYALRLIDEIQQSVVFEADRVDAVVQEGVSIIPLLIGVMRGWARDVLGDDEEFTVGESMALLGEIGDVAPIPALLEFVTLDNPQISGPSGWALNRIVEQNADAAVKVFSEVAPELSTQQRIAVLERILRFPAIVPSKDLLARLVEKLDRLEPDDRDDLFPSLVTSSILLLGPQGVEFARSMLRRHGGLLSRQARRDCDEMIEEFSGMKIPPRPAVEPSKWTIYDICNGLVDWDVDEEKESAEDDVDEEYVPEPIRKEARPGRNDPCWCGSGKKYKKCHLDSDEAAKDEIAEPPHGTETQPEGEFDAVRRRVGQFLTEVMPKREMTLAIEEFLDQEAPDDALGPMAMLDWLIHDRVVKALGRPVMEEYLRRNGATLTDRERAFLDSSARSYVDLYEVMDVKEGEGVEVKSLTSGESMFVRDVATSKVAVRWDGLFIRVVTAEVGLSFTGTGLRVLRTDLQSIRNWMEEHRRATDLTWPQYLKRNWPRVRARNLEIARERFDAIRLSNTDGEELTDSKAFYQIADRDELFAALRKEPKIQKDDGSFVWLTAKENGTVLGRFVIEGDRLVVECNSRERLVRAKNMIARLAGEAVRLEKDEFVTQEDLKREMRENPTPPVERKSGISSKDQRRMQQEYMEDFYAKWPDMKIPGLGGKTPRQAVKNAAGKRKVAEILKDIENTEARKRKSGEYGYDVARLRAELGIKG